jgi:hypothetical protein
MALQATGSIETNGSVPLGSQPVQVLVRAKEKRLMDKYGAGVLGVGCLCASTRGGTHGVCTVEAQNIIMAGSCVNCENVRP